jgi:hypothetical protein
MKASTQLTDAERETLIQSQKERLCYEKLSSDEKRQICGRMKLLINGRSKARVKEMEQEQGLSPAYIYARKLRE